MCVLVIARFLVFNALFIENFVVNSVADFADIRVPVISNHDAIALVTSRVVRQSVVYFALDHVVLVMRLGAFHLHAPT